MKIEVWTEHGPQNSKPIFEAFIKSLRDAGEEVVLNKSCNADVAVICCGVDVWNVTKTYGRNTGTTTSL